MPTGRLTDDPPGRAVGHRADGLGACPTEQVGSSSWAHDRAARLSRTHVTPLSVLTGFAGGGGMSALRARARGRVGWSGWEPGVLGLREARTPQRCPALGDFAQQPAQSVFGSGEDRLDGGEPPELVGLGGLHGLEQAMVGVQPAG